MNAQNFLILGALAVGGYLLYKKTSEGIGGAINNITSTPSRALNDVLGVPADIYQSIANAVATTEGGVFSNLGAAIARGVAAAGPLPGGLALTLATEVANALNVRPNLTSSTGNAVAANSDWVQQSYNPITNKVSTQPITSPKKSFGEISVFDSGGNFQFGYSSGGY